MTIRPATEDDLRAITRLVNDARLGSSELDWRRFMVADEAGQIIGCANLKIHRHGTRELHLLAVEPGRRGDGIGSRLVESLLEQEVRGQDRSPGRLWTRRTTQYHRALAGPGRRSRARAPERDETRHGMTADTTDADEATTTQAVGQPEPEAATQPEPEDLIHELSRAMHAAALSQHQRLVEDVARLRAAQAASVKARTASEAEQLKKTSQADIKEIDAWAKAATELIAAERVRRIDARRERLQAELVRQDIIAEREMMAVEVTIEDHQAALEAFFGRLEMETDPTSIASIASDLPSLPSLSDAGETARRHAIAEFAPIDEGDVGDETGDDSAEVSPSRLMAVMDPAMSTASGADSPAAWPEPHVIAVPAGAGPAVAGSEAAGRSDENAVPVAAGSRTLLRTVPTARPMDRLLGWNRTPGDDPDRED
jgi:GNAT superfamily N-acetyltransferase